MSAAVKGLVERLSPEVAEIVRQDLIQSVGNALRMQQREGQKALRTIANFMRHISEEKAECEKLEAFIAKEISHDGEWGAW